MRWGARHESGGLGKCPARRKYPSVSVRWKPRSAGGLAAGPICPRTVVNRRQDRRRSQCRMSEPSLLCRAPHTHRGTEPSRNGLHMRYHGSATIRKVHREKNVLDLHVQFPACQGRSSRVSDSRASTSPVPRTRSALTQAATRSTLTIGAYMPLGQSICQTPGVVRLVDAHCVWAPAACSYRASARLHALRVWRFLQETANKPSIMHDCETWRFPC